jgi:hypothetical protein
MERISFWPTREAAEKQAHFVQESAPDSLYFIKRMANGEWRLNFELAAPPAVSYMLELDAEELSALHQLLQTVQQMGELNPAEETIQGKVVRLMEGR